MAKLVFSTRYQTIFHLDTTCDRVVNSGSDPLMQGVNGKDICEQCRVNYESAQ